MGRKMLAVGVAAVLVLSAAASAGDLSSASMSRWTRASDTEKRDTARAAADAFMTEGKPGMRGKFADWLTQCVDAAGNDARKVASVIHDCATQYRER